MTKYKDIDSLIVKYLENEATHEERTRLDAWIKLSKENKRYFILCVKAWEATYIHFQDGATAARQFHHFHQHLRVRKRRKIFYTISSVAAAILIVFGISYLLPSNDTLVVVAATDHKREVKLEDGSIIWINKNSHVQYPENFNSHRTVYLTWEAYFDVAQGHKEPFIVETSEFLIKVLGTRFVITDYEEGTVAETILESGEIQLETQNKGESFLLKPGQKISHDKALSTTKLEVVDASNFTNWVNSALVFENSRLKDVFIQLEKWYGIRIECNEEALLQIPVSFSVDTETKEEIFNTLTWIAPFTWSLETNVDEKYSVITIKSK